MEYVIEREEEIKSSPTLAEYFKRRARDESSESTDEKLMNEWSDYCEYKCGLCQETLLSNLKFNLHVVRVHKLKKMKEYREKYGDPETTQRLHKCLLCFNNLKWEASRIRDHLKNKHNLKGKYPSLKEYGEKFKKEILMEIKKLGSSDSSNAQNEIYPYRLEQTLVGGTKKNFNPKEWKDLHQRKQHPRDRVSCPHCNITVQRSSLNKHMTRLHPSEMMRDLKMASGRITPEGRMDDDAENKDEEEVSRTRNERLGAEEVILDDETDLCHKFMIDNESGEIILLDSVESRNLSYITGEPDQDLNLQEVSNRVLIRHSIKKSTDFGNSEFGSDKDFESENDLCSENEFVPENEFETGPLDGKIVHVESLVRNENGYEEYNFEFIDEDEAGLDTEVDNTKKTDEEMELYQLNSAHREKKESKEVEEQIGIEVEQEDIQVEQEDIEVEQENIEVEQEKIEVEQEDIEVEQDDIEVEQVGINEKQDDIEQQYIDFEQEDIEQEYIDEEQEDIEEVTIYVDDNPNMYVYQRTNKTEYKMENREDGTEKLDLGMEVLQVEVGKEIDVGVSEVADVINPLEVEEAEKENLDNKMISNHLKEQAETLFEKDKSLDTIILSNSEGVHQIAIVRKKGSSTIPKNSQAKFLEHITSILGADEKMFQGKSGPLKIIEIEVDSIPERGENKVSRVAAAYAKKCISAPCALDPRFMSVGTQASSWTKMAGERAKVGLCKNHNF